jgi:hypothetical protein
MLICSVLPSALAFQMSGGDASAPGKGQDQTEACSLSLDGPCCPRYLLGFFRNWFLHSEEQKWYVFPW